MFKNKKILVLGMARSGTEVSKLLSKYDNDITINDMNNNQDESLLEELKSKNIKVVTGSHPDDLLDDSFDYLVKNPGIRNDHYYVLKAKELNIPVINELEVSYSFLPNNVKIIGITGTNGKTTTTTLIYEMLKKAYPNNTHLVGNIGYPFSSFIGKIKENDLIVCEISIQQLCNFDKFKTNISVMTNLSEAHLDFVGNYNNYKEIKKRICLHHTNKEIAILNNDDDDLVDLTKDINSNKLYFSKKKESTCYIKDNFINYLGENIINIDNILVKGDHNLENIMAAITAVKQFNVNNDIIIDVLTSFKGVEHRLEFVCEKNKRLFYNDSKATNNISTIIALKSFTFPVHLIMGGLDRGQDFSELTPYLTYVKSISAYGENKKNIEKWASNNNIKIDIFDTLKEASLNAYNNSLENEVILLSPASASWDQYKCFEDRGNDFKNIIKEI